MYPLWGKPVENSIAQHVHFRNLLNNPILCTLSGMKLSRYLKDNKITDVEFATQVHATPFAVGKWRRGERTPRDVFMRRIVKATCGAVTPNDFLNFSDESDSLKPANSSPQHASSARPAPAHA